jgi:hypothetical protein
MVGVEIRAPQVNAQTNGPKLRQTAESSFKTGISLSGMLIRRKYRDSRDQTNCRNLRLKLPFSLSQES